MEEEKKKEEIKEPVNETKKPLIIAIVAVVVSLLVIYFCITSLLSLGEGYIKVKGAKAKVVLDQTKAIQYEKYDNGLVSFNIPKDCEVDVAPLNV